MIVISGNNFGDGILEEAISWYPNYRFFFRSDEFFSPNPLVSPRTHLRWVEATSI